MLRLLYILIFCLFNSFVSGQKDCHKSIYQIAESGWISRSITLDVKSNQDCSIRFVSSIKGLTATMTMTKRTAPLAKGDYWIFITNTGEKRAFASAEKTRTVSFEGKEQYVTTIIINWSGIEWLAKNKVSSFGAMDKTLEKNLLPEVKLSGLASRTFWNLSKCFYYSIDKQVPNNIEEPPLDEKKLEQVELPELVINVLEFNNIDINAESNPIRYSGVDQPNYAKGLSQMAELYQAANDPVKAEQYYLEAQQNIVQFSGIDYGDYPNLLNNLATFYQQVGDVQKAKKKYLEAKDLIEKVFGNHHPQYPITLNNLGALHLSVNELENSEEYHNQARSLLEDEFSTSHPEYTTTLGHLSNFYLIKKDYKKALEVLTDLSKNLIHQLYSYYPSLNEAERLVLEKSKPNGASILFLCGTIIG